MTDKPTHEESLAAAHLRIRELEDSIAVIVSAVLTSMRRLPKLNTTRTCLDDAMEEVLLMLVQRPGNEEKGG